jgi:hypothetical protein
MLGPAPNQEGPAQHVPAVSTETVEGARQPCPDWLDARHLAMLLIHPKGFHCEQFFYAASKFCEQVSAVSKFFQQILALSKFDIREQFFFTVSKFSSL